MKIYLATFVLLFTLHSFSQKRINFTEKKIANLFLNIGDMYGGDGDGTNSSGFSALPGGFRYNDGRFGGVGEFGLWWCNNDQNYDYQPFYILYNTQDKITANLAIEEDDEEGEELQEDEFYLGFGFSVRCVKD